MYNGNHTAAQTAPHQPDAGYTKVNIMTTIHAVNEQAKKLEQDRTELAHYLYQTAALLHSDRFAKWFNNTSASRFDWATPAVYAAIARNLDVQSSEPVEQWAVKLAQLLVEAADRLTVDNPVAQKHKAFTVSRNITLASAIFTHFGKMKGKQLNRFLEALRSLNHQFPASTWGWLMQLTFYVTARSTLERDTGWPWFERILETRTEEYMTSGYPLDLLAHDVSAVVTAQDMGEPVPALAVSRNYCSTWTSVGFASVDELAQTVGPNFDIHTVEPALQAV